MPEGLIPHVPHHLEGNFIVDGVDHPLHHAGGGHDDADLIQQRNDAGQGHLAGADDLIDGLADEHGHIEGQGHGDGGKEDGQSHQGPIGFQIDQHFFQGAALGPLLGLAHSAASFLNWES